MEKVELSLESVDALESDVLSRTYRDCNVNDSNESHYMACYTTGCKGCHCGVGDGCFDE